MFSMESIPNVIWNMDSRLCLGTCALTHGARYLVCKRFNLAMERTKLHEWTKITSASVQFFILMSYHENDTGQVKIYTHCLRYNDHISAPPPAITTTIKGYIHTKKESLYHNSIKKTQIGARMLAVTYHGRFISKILFPRSQASIYS